MGGTLTGEMSFKKQEYFKEETKDQCDLGVTQAGWLPPSEVMFSWQLGETTSRADKHPWPHCVGPMGRLHHLLSNHSLFYCVWSITVQLITAFVMIVLIFKAILYVLLVFNHGFVVLLCDCYHSVYVHSLWSPSISTFVKSINHCWPAYRNLTETHRPTD